MSTLLLVSLVILGGAAFLSSRLIPHRRLTTLLASMGAFLEAYWLFVIWITSFIESSASASLIVTSILFVIALVAFWKFKQPFAWRGSGMSDVMVIITLLCVIGGAAIVSRANGLQGTDFVMHGFYNGDVVTFAALVQKALVTDSALIGNPFAGNGPLEYPTLLHHSLATLFSANPGLDWLHFWPLLVYAQLAITVPLFFLLWDIILPEPAPGELWLGVRRRVTVRAAQVVLTFATLTLSWDNFIYPQSHFFLTSTFLLLAAILFSRQQTLPVQLILALPLTVALLFSNAVTGTAAVVFFCVYILATILERGIAWIHRLSGLLAIIVVMALFLLATPGNAAFGLPHFSYTAVSDLARLLPWFGVLLIGIALQFTQRTRESVALLAVAAVTFIVLFFSTRELVVANASRFIYHALLIGTPLLLRPLLRAGWYLRREFLLSSRSAVEYAIGFGLVGLGVASLLLPNVASVASAYDNLLFNDEQRISFQRREVLWWLADHTPASSIIVANPGPPWDIPLFSGRALLRAGDEDGAYWLSNDDETLRQLQAAFAGDRAAQAEIIKHGHYLVLSAEEQEYWTTTTKPIFATKLYRIYQIQ